MLPCCKSVTFDAKNQIDQFYDPENKNKWARYEDSAPSGDGSGPLYISGYINFTSQYLLALMKDSKVIFNSVAGDGVVLSKLIKELRKHKKNLHDHFRVNYFDFSSRAFKYAQENLRDMPEVASMTQINIAEAKTGVFRTGFESSQKASASSRVVSVVDTRYVIQHISNYDAFMVYKRILAGDADIYITTQRHLSKNPVYIHKSGCNNVNVRDLTKAPYYFPKPLTEAAEIPPNKRDRPFVAVFRVADIRSNWVKKKIITTSECPKRVEQFDFNKFSS